MKIPSRLSIDLEVKDQEVNDFMNFPIFPATRFNIEDLTAGHSLPHILDLLFDCKCWPFCWTFATASHGSGITSLFGIETTSCSG